jgi:glycerophosphoryl diester phosphodiesterase
MVASCAQPQTGPLVIAHRGASGYLPEHTLEAYRLGIEQGADFIEPDLVATRDHVLVTRHEPDITATTDVASRPEFADRRRKRVIDGYEVDGWFTVDFTLAELRTLRAVQPRRERPQQYNGRFQIPTFDEVVALAQSESKRLGRTIGVYPETKHPTWHCEQGLALETALLATLRAAGWTDRNAPIFIQSFEAGNLRYLRKLTTLRLVQLVDADELGPNGSPIRHASTLPPSTCATYPRGEVPLDFRSVATFRTVAEYADVIAPWKRFLVGVDGGNHLRPPTQFVALARTAGLDVHVWTFRSEASQLAADYAGDPRKEYLQFYRLGVQGVFSDFPDTAIAAREELTRGTPLHADPEQGTPLPDPQGPVPRT